MLSWEGGEEPMKILVVLGGLHSLGTVQRLEEPRSPLPQNFGRCLEVSVTAQSARFHPLLGPPLPPHPRCFQPKYSITQESGSKQISSLSLNGA